MMEVYLDKELCFFEEIKMVPCLQCIHLYMRKKNQIDTKFHQEFKKNQSLGCGKIPTDQVQQPSHSTFTCIPILLWI